MFDYGYFARALSLFLRYKGKKKKGNLFDDYIVKSRCWTNDLDLNWHMNNSRYVRECDFGRLLYLLETGLWDIILERRKNGIKDCGILVSALQVQYRQSIQLGDKFQIVTRMNGWDDKAFYMEQLIILEESKQIAFLLAARFAVTPRTLSPQMLIDDLYHGSIQSPKLSSTVEKFKENYQLNFPSMKSKI